MVGRLSNKMQRSWLMCIGKFCRNDHPADCIHGTRLHLTGVRPDGTTAAKLKGTDTKVSFHFFGQSSFAKWSFVQETCALTEGLEATPTHV